ncbi:unnamed protein product [Dibothriocephalus latus]|uniref:Uncharacterized protein n=1 Tax=Dibothriocephalus latus TaxID=60516 RepID=A0A3P6PC76_DIBLA|nr:unnamed protein product [Dibothriocephalus latus]
MGDVSERKQILKKLKCKSFKWYLDNIYPEMFIPSESLASGEVRAANVIIPNRKTTFLLIGFYLFICAPYCDCLYV